MFFPLLWADWERSRCRRFFWLFFGCFGGPHTPKVFSGIDIQVAHVLTFSTAKSEREILIGEWGAISIFGPWRNEWQHVCILHLWLPSKLWKTIREQQSYFKEKEQGLKNRSRCLRCSLAISLRGSNSETWMLTDNFLHLTRSALQFPAWQGNWYA